MSGSGARCVTCRSPTSSQLATRKSFSDAAPGRHLHPGLGSGVYGLADKTLAPRAGCAPRRRSEILKIGAISEVGP